MYWIYSLVAIPRQKKLSHKITTTAPQIVINIPLLMQWLKIVQSEAQNTATVNTIKTKAIIAKLKVGSGIQMGLYIMGLTTSVIGTVDLFFQLGKTSLIQILHRGTQSLSAFVLGRRYITSILIRSTIGFLGRTFMMSIIFALNPWVSLGLFICQAIHELNESDEIEKWLERCRFGEFQAFFHDKKSFNYKSQQQEVEASKAILMKYEKKREEDQKERQKRELEENQPVIMPGDWQNILTYPVVP